MASACSEFKITERHKVLGGRFNLQRNASIYELMRRILALAVMELLYIGKYLLTQRIIKHRPFVLRLLRIRRKCICIRYFGFKCVRIRLLSLLLIWISCFKCLKWVFSSYIVIQFKTLSKLPSNSELCRNKQKKAPSIALRRRDFRSSAL